MAVLILLWEDRARIQRYRLPPLRITFAAISGMTARPHSRDSSLTSKEQPGPVSAGHTPTSQVLVNTGIAVDLGGYGLPPWIPGMNPRQPINFDAMMREVPGRPGPTREDFERMQLEAARRVRGDHHGSDEDSVGDPEEDADEDATDSEIAPTLVPGTARIYFEPNTDPYLLIRPTSFALMVVVHEGQTMYTVPMTHEEAVEMRPNVLVFWRTVSQAPVMEALSPTQDTGLRSAVSLFDFFGQETTEAREAWPQFMLHFNMFVEMAAHLGGGLLCLPGEEILEQLRDWDQQTLPNALLLSATLEPCPRAVELAEVCREAGVDDGEEDRGNCDAAADGEHHLHAVLAPMAVLTFARAWDVQDEVTIAPDYEAFLLGVIGQNAEKRIVIPGAPEPEYNPPVDWDDWITQVRGDWLDDCDISPTQKIVIADLLTGFRELSNKADIELFQEMWDKLRRIYCKTRSGAFDVELDLREVAEWLHSILQEDVFKEYREEAAQTHLPWSEEEFAGENLVDEAILQELLPSRVLVDAGTQTEGEE
ncbi:hypothetical protein C8T65DRAFT_699588 [Cerioporus squamosus]|nr:hypothetical protein C8T65DRAFT_699588 [Cerioporus squamosus]